MTRTGTLKLTTPSDREIVMKRVFNAPREHRLRCPYQVRSAQALACAEQLNTRAESPRATTGLMNLEAP